ncbi:MAG: ABC transporter ATP-binding protein [Acidobacteriota bacterium]
MGRSPSGRSEATSADPRPVLTTTDLRVTTRRGEALVRGVDLRVAAGEMVGLVGESGSGKTLTALAVAGLLPHRELRSTGEIRLGGEAIHGLPPGPRRRLLGRRIGMVFQEPMAAFNPSFTIGFQVGEVLRLHHGLGKAEARRETRRLLDRMAIPQAEGRLRSYPHELSGGQLQRVALAMALAGRPEMLLADEPTTALDVTLQAQILDLLEELRHDLDLGILFITHDLAVVANRCSRAIVLRHGEVIESGPVADVLQNPEHPYTGELIAAYPRLEPRATSASLQGAEIVAEARDLHHTYRLPGGAEVKALDGIDLRLAAGSTQALVGESGSGKSTLARALVGLLRPDSGAVHFGGEDLRTWSGAELRRRRRQFQLVFQDPGGSLSPRVRVGKLLAEPLEIHRLEASAERIAELLREVGLEPKLARRYPHQLSGGQRQRLAIARALACGPRLVVADEPVSGLDMSLRRQVLDLLAELQRTRGMTLVLVSHDLAMVARAADRVAVMQNGRVVEEGPTGEIFASPKHPHTTALLAASPRLP